jgi:hypothetical protein
LKKVFPLTPFQKLLFWGAFFRFLAAEIRKKAPQTPKERKRLGFATLHVFNLRQYRPPCLPDCIIDF